MTEVRGSGSGEVAEGDGVREGDGVIVLLHFATALLALGYPARWRSETEWLKR